MRTIIRAINNAHGNINKYDYGSPLEAYIKAKLTTRNTVRILLDADQYNQQSQAIAQDISERIIDTVISFFE